MSITIRSKVSTKALFNLILLLVPPVSIIIVMILLEIQSKDNILSVLSEIWFVLILIIAFILYVLDRVLWQISGYEQVEFDSSNFKTIRKGKLLTEKFIVATSDICSIEEQDVESEDFSFFRNPLMFSRDIGETGGRIIIRYGRDGKNSFEFGMGLSPHEVKFYTEQMKGILKSLDSN